MRTAAILIVGYILIGAAEQTQRRYATFCLIFTIFAHVMDTFGLAFSIWLHQRGLGWKVAHDPVYVLVYSVCLAICLIQQTPSTRTDHLAS